MRIVQTILMKYHTLFFRKLGKMSSNLSSTAVVIGALRVKTLKGKLTKVKLENVTTAKSDNPLHARLFCMLFCHQIFQHIISEIAPEGQAVWFQIRFILCRADLSSSCLLRFSSDNMIDASRQREMENNTPTENQRP